MLNSFDLDFARSGAKRAKEMLFLFRSLVAREPNFWLLYQPYVLWDQMKIRKSVPVRERVVLSDTELVIDGFQGSANSFATVTFKKSQSHPVKLAHHMHSPVQVIQAVNRGIPILLTIRDPENTVLSLTSRWPYISVNSGLKSYIAFYAKLQPYLSNCIVSPFDLTIQRMDLVVEALNMKFGTNFELVDISRLNEEVKSKTHSPSEIANRKQTKQGKRLEFSSKENIELLKEANLLYRSYTPFLLQDTNT